MKDLFSAFVMRKASEPGPELARLAACAQAVDSWFHAAHLATSGVGFAGDHGLTYEAVYDRAGGVFDSLMERAIGLSGESSLASPWDVLERARYCVESWPMATGPAESIAAGAVTVCDAFISRVKDATEALRDAGTLTQGTDNLLAQAADDFEGFAYKLRQRARAPIQKGADVDALIARVMGDSGVDKGAAIAILKSKGVVKQDGEHLVMAKRKVKRKPKPVKEMLV